MRRAWTPYIRHVLRRQRPIIEVRFKIKIIGPLDADDVANDVVWDISELKITRRGRR